MARDEDIAIVGVGMTPVGKHIGTSLAALGGQAIALALADAGREIGDVEAVFVANAMAAVVTGQVSTAGQVVMRASGFERIPVFNVDNACASSSSAIHLAVSYVRSGSADTVLVLGVEKLMHEDRSRAYRAINGAAEVELVERSGIDPARQSFFVHSVYPQRLERYRAAYGLDAATLAAIAVKNRTHAADNPFAQLREPVTMQSVLESKQIVGPVTALMCCPVGDGAAAVIVTSRRRLHSADRPVWIRGSAVGMGGGSDQSPVARIAAAALQQAAMTPRDIQLAEVHDSIAFNELVAYEELGFAAPGQGKRLVEEGATSRGGAIPVNVSGGLESRGHPVAATGTAQLHELVLQLRGEAGTRQVAGAHRGLAENAGGFARDDTAAVAVTVLEA